MKPIVKILSGIGMVLVGTAVTAVGAITTSNGLTEKAFDDAVENGDVEVTEF